MDVDITRLVDDVDPAELSASIAERGANAGPETWANARQAAVVPLDIANHDEVRAWLAGFGAWDRDEIAGWSVQELDALVLQSAAGDLREAQALCPGDGLAGVDWDAAEQLAHEGTICGSLYANGDRLWIYIGN